MDLIITNGEIVHGTGTPKFRGNVGVKDGRIVAVGKVGGVARSTADAEVEGGKWTGETPGKLLRGEQVA
jgi:N-acyl-D-aspartate/D-glutamate deacylase